MYSVFELLTEENGCSIHIKLLKKIKQFQRENAQKREIKKLLKNKYIRIQIFVVHFVHGSLVEILGTIYNLRSKIFIIF